MACFSPCFAGVSPRSGTNKSRCKADAAALLSATLVHESEVQAEPCRATVRYVRKDADYDGWGLHVWGGAKHETAWEEPLRPESSCEQGLVFNVEGTGSINFIVHRGEEKDTEGVVQAGSDVWASQGSVFGSREEMIQRAVGTLDEQRAFWVSRDLIALPRELACSDADRVVLQFSPDAGIKVCHAAGVQNASSEVVLRPAGALPASIRKKFPHIEEFMAFNVDCLNARAMLKGQLAVSVTKNGSLVAVTGVQIAGVIDDLCTYQGPLGVHFATGLVTLTLWAPTAASVRVVLYKGASSDKVLASIDMQEGSCGEWTASAKRRDWENAYFVYELMVFCPWTNRMEKVVSTDPYSHSLSANGLRTHIADLSASAAKPRGWDGFRLPQAPHPVDMAIYELHVRDFSACDETLPAKLRGTYAAFGARAKKGGGVAHLSALAEAGITHIHLLPAYDFGTVDEVKSRWQVPVLPKGVKSLRDLPPDSELQQELLTPTLDHDSFNWGYDPQHYSAPEGSYASDPDGIARVQEFRDMVKNLADLKLRVVMDVVYNHVLSSGPTSPTSVLDKVVPGYYLRRSLSGAIENSTCMNNTASEHVMFDRLIVDSVVHWAREYRVSGFRFDLMGHIMLSTMQRVRSALDALTLESDGIDGKSIYLYGEGWEFGEVAGGARGRTACQLNLAGTGIGSFSDRIREAVVGGNPFGDPRVQGFATGLGTFPNAYSMEVDDQQEKLVDLQKDTERLIAGLAGNLAEYRFVGKDAKELKARDAGWQGSNCAYAAVPAETVNYVSAHDNETLFDMMAWKLPAGSPPEEYARRSLLCTALVAYAQGVPFFHAGDDILRSKSLDRDSYNSGDHFNRLDWTLQSNNFGVGLPPKSKNGDKWDLMRGLLSKKSCIAPSPEIIQRTTRVFREFLMIRRSSPLFRLRTLEDVQARVRFFNRGIDAKPGVIVMELSDGTKGVPGMEQIDPKYAKIVVVFNALTETYEHKEEALLTATAGLAMRLHPVLAESVDLGVRSATWLAGVGGIGGGPVVPACTAAVFVSIR